ncbi:hypothetical protein niasHS_018018 [Heterodera schachtii]|uniref:Uncharacterized protein n=1 Tax=Heterodera schachtii TaxID=97005 RepID=A0ABD2HZK5_HETSC
MELQTSWQHSCCFCRDPPEHPLLKSLTFLHQHIDRKFEAQGRFIEGALSSLRSAQDLNHYDTVVNVPLARLTKIFKKVINPAKTKTHKEQFVAACTRWQFTPLHILEFINTKVNINCKKKKTREMLPIISEVKSVFDEVFVIINDQKYATSYENFFTTYIVFTKKDGPDFDLDELIRSIFAVVPGPFSDVCLLRSVYESYAAKRNELMRLSESVTIDVIDTALIGGFCANLSFSCAAEQVEEQLEELGSYVRDITGNMSQWIGKELVSLIY